jgi:ribosomal protein L11 methyltransferase
MSLKVTLTVDPAAIERLSSDLFDLGANGIEEENNKLIVWFDDKVDETSVKADLLKLLERNDLLTDADHSTICQLESIVDLDWNSEWKKKWSQQYFGKRLSICPSWIKPEEAAERIIIRMDPGNAFGTGSHESTTLLLNWLDEIGDFKGMNVFDAGCGTGVLAIAALKLGAEFAVGIDIEAESVENSRLNAKINDCRKNSHFTLATPASMQYKYSFDLVLANIQRSVIEEFFADLLRVTSPGGTILVAGILAIEKTAMLSLAKDFNLDPPRIKAQGEWIALMYTKPLE